MADRRAPATWRAGLLATVLLAGPAQAQTSDQASLDAMAAARIEQARAAYAALPPPARCDSGGDDGEIVVCARTDSSRYRVPPTSTTDPASRGALRTGVPRAPQLDRGSCRGQPGCITGGFTPPPVYAIDLQAIPEAPQGSDADLVARGQKSDR